jgi:hypothetical protein
MNVILLHSNHRHVTSTLMAIFMVTRTRILGAVLIGINHSKVKKTHVYTIFYQITRQNDSEESIRIYNSVQDFSWENMRF